MTRRIGTETEKLGRSVQTIQWRVPVIRLSKNQNTATVVFEVSLNSKQLARHAMGARKAETCFASELVFARHVCIILTLERNAETATG